MTSNGNDNSGSRTTSARAARIETLARALKRDGVLHLKQASELLEVSEMTVRRDVSATPERFVYLGAHIFAAPVRGEYRLSDEDAALTAAKAAASSHALRLIPAHSTIFIDSGTTLLHLADQIPAALDVTIVTNSLHVASRVAAKPDLRLVMIGGLYQPASDSFSTDSLDAQLAGLSMNIGFFSVGGADRKHGASCYQYYELALKLRLLGAVTKKYLVVDSSKLGVIKPAFLAPLSAFDMVLTEKGPLGH